jgi:murein L,D-transpeptidase YafK
MDSMPHARRRITWLAVGLLSLGIIGTAGILIAVRMYPTIKGKHTVESRLRDLDPARSRLSSMLRKHGIESPPTSMIIVAFKREKQMEVFVRGVDASGKSTVRMLKQYPILGASGDVGPKMREGDRQVPEGLYRLESLNPNSRFHLALRVNYPSPEDIAQGKADGRDVETLGSDIMIHGGSSSVGCLAMGDPAVEELFLLAASCGPNVDIVLSPSRDPLKEIGAQTPQWIAARYRSIARKLDELKPLIR